MMEKNKTELLLVHTKLQIKNDTKAPDLSGYGVALPTLTAYEREQGIVTRIYDTSLCTDTYEQIVKKIVEENSLVLGISRITTNYIEEIFEFIDDIRRYGYRGFIFLGGHAATIEYEKCLLECSGCDCVVMGEGEVTIAELVYAIRKKEPWQNIKGIAYVDASGIKRNPLRPLISDIDSIPFMATDLLEQLQEIQGKRNITAYLVSSRGCYKKCSFCSIAAYFDMFEGCRMRYRSVENVFNEMKSLYYAHGIRKFCFWDDTFIIPGKKGIERCHRLAELIKTLPEKISLEIATRVDTISYEVIALLKEAGLKHIHLGIESFIDRDLVLYNKGVTVEQNIEALSILEDLGFSTKVGSKLRIATYLISFNPFTTLEDIRHMIFYFKKYEISPKKQVTFLHVSNYAPIKQKLINNGIKLGLNNEWEFLDERVSYLSEKYYNFVQHAMKTREKLRTLEKSEKYNNDIKLLNEIKLLRENIDNKCTEFLEKLVDYFDNNMRKESIEAFYKKNIDEFNDFVGRRMELEVELLLSQLGDFIIMQQFTVFGPF